MRNSLLLVFSLLFLIILSPSKIVFARDNHNSNKGEDHPALADSQQQDLSQSSASSSADSQELDSSQQSSSSAASFDQPSPSPTLQVVSEQGSISESKAAVSKQTPDAQSEDQVSSAATNPPQSSPTPQPVVSPPVTLISPTLTAPTAYSQRISRISYPTSSSAPTPSSKAKSPAVLTPPINFLVRSLKTDYYGPATISRNASIMLEGVSMSLLLGGILILNADKVQLFLARFRFSKERSDNWNILTRL